MTTQKRNITNINKNHSSFKILKKGSWIFNHSFMSIFFLHFSYIYLSRVHFYISEAHFPFLLLVSISHEKKWTLLLIQTDIMSVPWDRHKLIREREWKKKYYVKIVISFPVNFFPSFVVHFVILVTMRVENNNTLEKVLFLLLLLETNVCCWWL